jgi:DNA ligase-3
MMNRAMKEGLEGLVLKPLDSVYEPGKRHWMKMKKDYLQDGSMADSADLVVLGTVLTTNTPTTCLTPLAFSLKV